MKLTFDEIKALSVGATGFKEINGALWFEHYRDETIARFGELNDFWHKGATCTTGVRLDFHTDATCVEAVVAGTGKYEILVDGLMAKSESVYAGDVISEELGAGEKRVTLVLPSHSRGGIKELNLKGATKAYRHKFDCKMLFIGDSITQGWNAHFDSGSYAYLTGRNYNADSVIQGVGGMVFHPDLFDSPEFEPDVIVVAYGCNDFSARKSLSELAEYANGFLDKLCARYPAVKKFGIVPIWRRDAETAKEMGSFSECRATIEKCLLGHGFITVDGYALVPHTAEYFADAVHPNDLGFAEMARNLALVINSK